MATATSASQKNWVVAFVFALALALGLGAVAIAIAAEADALAVSGAGGATFAGVATLSLQAAKALGLTE